MDAARAMRSLWGSVLAAHDKTTQLQTLRAARARERQPTLYEHVEEEAAEGASPEAGPAPATPRPVPWPCRCGAILGDVAGASPPEQRLTLRLGALAGVCVGKAIMVTCRCGRMRTWRLRARPRTWRAR